MRIHQLIGIALILSLGLSACADEYGNRKPMTDTQKGALIGALGGAAIGAAVGGLAGAGVGAYMDSQKKDLEKVLAPEQNRGDIQIDRLDEKTLRVTMTAQSAFAVDSAEIKGNFHSTLDKIAQVVNKYGKTVIGIVGHTDNTGTQAHNQTLSEQRAAAVQRYLLARNVAPQRLTASGRGETEPRASNATEEGRALNRRVELFIVAVVADRNPG